MGYRTRSFNKNEDKDALFALWREKSEKNFQRRFEHMYGAGARCQIITSFLFDEKSQDPAGSVSLFTHTLRIKGGDFKLGVNCDMFVKKEHRLLGPAVILLKSLAQEARQGGYQALLAMPNKMSAPVFQRAGYAPIGELYRWVKILRFEDKLAVKIKNRVVLKIISKAFNFLFEFFSCEGISRIAYFFAQRQLTAREIKFTEINLDQHLKETSILEKSPGYIEWRYYGVDNNGSQAFALTKNGLTKGLILYSLRQQDAIIQDMLLPKSFWAAKMMLCAFTRKMRKEKIKSISILFLGRGRMTRLLKSFAFFRRGRRGLYLYAFDSKFENDFADKHALDLCEGDLDL